SQRLMSENLRAWSRRMAQLELGQEIRAGSFGFEDVPARVESEAIPNAGLESNVIFAKFVDLMRRKRGLTGEELAETCNVEVSEASGLKDRSAPQLEPRTVYPLSNCFNLSVSKMMQLAGLKTVEDTSLATSALRFAARSKSMESLTKE